MATVSSVSASPTTVAPGGGTTTVTPVISNPDVTATVTVTLDGASGSAPVVIHETLTYSVDPADLGKRGYVVATVDKGGTLTVGADNQSFVFTAS